MVQKYADTFANNNEIIVAYTTMRSHVIINITNYNE